MYDSGNPFGFQKKHSGKTQIITIPPVDIRIRNDFMVAR